MLVCDHKVMHEDFKFLGNESNRYLLKLRESLLIKRDRPSLNKNLYLQEVLLFVYSIYDNFFYLTLLQILL